MSVPIQVEHVSKRFGNVVALEDVSFGVRHGEILALIGPSGSGKSTSLRLIGGFERPDAGSIAIGGRVVAGPGTHLPPERRGVGMVFQDYALFPHLSVRANVSFGLRSRGRERDCRVEEMLALVNLDGYGDRYPHQLSGGQQQRVALARALAPAPTVLLLDEPLSNLDADLRDQTRRELAAILRAANTTTVIVTHDQQEALILADRVAVLIQGRLEQVSTPEDVYQRPATRVIADFVGEADFLPARAAGRSLLTEIGPLPSVGYPEGRDLEVMIRPDDLEITPDDSSPIEIVERQYRGEEVAYALRLASGRIIHSHLREGELKVGTRVVTRVRAREVVAFPAESNGQR